MPRRDGKAVWPWVFLTLGLLLSMSVPGRGGEPDWPAWNHGLALQDKGQPGLAAAHFTRTLQKSLAAPQARRASDHLLTTLAGWLDVRQALVHADSVTILGEDIPPLPPAPLSRYLAAEKHARTHLFGAAADSFAALARWCAASRRPADAWQCRIRSARCRIDQGDSLSLVKAAALLDEHPATDFLPQRAALIQTLTRANIHFMQDKLTIADGLYHQVAEQAAAAGFTTLQSDALNAQGALASKQRRLQESADRYAQARDLAHRLADPYRRCLTLANLGYQQTNLRLFAESRTNLERADTLARRWGFTRLRGPIHSGLGALHEMQGNRGLAVAHFRQAVDLGREQANNLAELGARQRLAYNLAMMGRYSEARQHFQACLETLDRTGGRFILNWVLGGLAYSNQELGYLDEAERQFARARDVNLAMGDRMSAAWCLNSLGDIHALRGEYRQALLLQDQARAQYRDLDDTEGEGQAQASMAEVYLRLGNYHQALEHADKAARLAERAGAEELLRWVSATQAAVFAATGQPDRAKQELRRVLDITRRWQDRVAEIWALHDLAEHALQEGDVVAARPLLDQAWQLLGDEPHHRARSAVALLRSRSLQDQDGEQALAWARRATSHAHEGDLPHRLWPAQAQVGRCLRGLGRLDEAEEELLEAVTTLERLRRRAGSDELRRHMLNPAAGPYLELVALYTVDRGQPQRAFAVSERFRSRLLAEGLRAALEPRTEARRETGAAAARRGLLARLSFLQTRLQAGDAQTAGHRDSLRAEIAEVEHQLSLLEDRPAAPRDNVGTGGATPDRILRPGEHLLSYLLGPDRSYLFSVTGKQTRVHLLPARQVVEEKAELFLRLFRHRADPGAEPLPAQVVDRAARQLHELLLGPVQKDLQPDATLLLALDGVLHDLPLAYLRDAHHDLLLEKHASFVVPSLETLGYLRQRPPGRGSLLAVGCAGGAAEGDRQHLFTDTPLPPLPGAEAEARQVVRSYGAGQVLLGAEAREGELRRAVREGHRILHLAAHGYADEKDPRRSYVVLNRGEAWAGMASPETGAADTAGPAPDGLLQWHEIAALDLRADLVTLASCRSARGVRAAGEGVSGLAQAFLHGGGRCVLAALADVPDQASGEIMDRFYAKLGDGASAAEALRRAQLSVLAASADGWPRLGGFVLVGDGQVCCPAPSAAAGWRRAAIPLAVAVLLLLAGTGSWKIFVRFRKKGSPRT